MAQQLNLFDARFAPVKQRFTAAQGLGAVAGVLLLSAAAAQGLQWAGAQASAQALALQAGVAPLRQQLMALAAAAPPPGNGGELARLQALEAGQRRVRTALEAGIAGAREGHADYLVALARQAHGALWITGFSVSEDGSAIELEGRMSDANVLADYLRRLNAEPRFKGRPFAQLSLRAVDSNGQPLPYTEFALRSGPGGPASPAAGSAAIPSAFPAHPQAATTLAAHTP